MQWLLDRFAEAEPSLKALVHKGQPFLMIDTAGIRKKAKIDTSVEAYSVARSERSIRRADISVLVIDASRGVTAQERKIAGTIVGGHAAELAAAPPTADEIARVTEPMKQLITRASTGNGFYMYQLEGGAFAPEKFGQIRSILSDYSTITPDRLQELARRYLVPGKAWMLKVVPGGK